MVIIYTLASNFTAKGVQAADDVEDLERSLAFYRDGLGLPTKGVVGTEFVGNATDAAGAPRTELAKDSEIMPGSSVPEQPEVSSPVIRMSGPGAFIRVTSKTPTAISGK